MKKKFRSISETITLKTALWLLVVTMIATGMTYLLISSIVKNLMVENLTKHITLRGERESQIFHLAEKDHELLARRAVLQLSTKDSCNYDDLFAKNFSVFPDGAIRDRNGINNVDHPGFFIGKSVRLNIDIKRTSVQLYEFLDRECLLVLASFSACWIGDTNHGLLGVFDQQEDTYVNKTDAEFDNLQQLWMKTVYPEDNPERLSRWTKSYVDQNVNIWMITLATPIYVADQLVAVIGSDLHLDALFKRLTDFNIEGTTSLIFNENGELIFHPEFKEQIQQANSLPKLSELENGKSTLFNAYLMAHQNMPFSEKNYKGKIFDLDSKNLLAVTRLEGPRWYLATLYPKSIISTAAFKASRLVLILGCVGLLVELLMLISLIRQKLARPLSQLIDNVEKVSSGDLKAKVFTKTEDEFEILGDAFNEMTHNLGLSRAESQAALERALDASRVKSEFLATMSHEIRTPLNGILGMTQVLQASPLTEVQQRQMALVFDSGNHLLHLINQILDAVQLDRKEFELRKTNFNISNLLNEVQKSQSFLANAKKLKLNFKNHIQEKFFFGDADRLTQTLNILVDNAIKFSNTGEISITVEKPDQNNSNLRFTVRDQGIGVSAEARNKIFMPFTQADASMSRHYGGTGLGLYLAKSFVEMMGGKIGINAEIKTGSEFWFQVPLPVAEISDVETTTEPETTFKKDRKPILIVEDNPINQVLTEALVDKLGYSAVITKDGKEAVDAFEPNKFSLILMDCQMPNMDGYEATRQIRIKEAGHARIPILALTANTSEADRAECLKSGMDEMLSKPVKFGGFKERLEHWLK